MPQMQVSIVVIAKNEQKQITACLDSLCAQVYPESLFEIIVVDHMSTDDTPEIVKGYRPHANNIVLVTNEHPSIAESRNKGVSVAKYPYVAFTDADCVVPKTWLSELITGWEEEEVRYGSWLASVGGGNILSGQKESVFRGTLGIMLQTYLGSRGSLTGMRLGQRQVVRHIPTVNVLYKKSILEKLPFDTRVKKNGEDQILSWLLQDYGYVSVYLNNTPVLHRGPESLLEWCSSMILYGRSRIFAFSLFPSHSDSISLLALVPLLVILLILFSSIFGGMLFQISLILLGVYVILLSIYSLVSLLKMKNSVLFVPSLICLYGYTHVCYGIGLTLGLLDLCCRKMDN